MVGGELRDKLGRDRRNSESHCCHLTSMEVNNSVLMTEQADLQMPGVCSRTNLILFLALKFGKQVALNHCLKPQTN